MTYPTTPSSPTELVLEVWVPSEGWRESGRLTENDPLGTVSSDEEPRQLYLFGWDNGVARVWRSVAGIDIADAAMRLVVPTHGLERLADLSSVGSYTLDLRRASGIIRTRFRIA